MAAAEDERAAVTIVGGEVKPVFAGTTAVEVEAALAVVVTTAVQVEVAFGFPYLMQIPVAPRAMH